MKAPERAALAVILVLYLALAVSYSLANPLYESTDELRHVRYVRHIAVHRELPVQRAGALHPFPGRVREGSGDRHTE